MIELFVGRPVSNRDIMEKIWRFRHEQFVERFGWEALRRDDGREIDQFDGDNALHLALFCKDRVVAYSRLLPTIEPHLLSDVYPKIMNGQQWPRALEVYEWTRCVADERDVLINQIPASHVLMTGVMEFCLVAGITSLIVETHPKLVTLLVSLGWQVTPLALPSLLNDTMIVPVEARPSAAGLIQHHRLYSLEGSALALVPGVRNPLRPGACLGQLSFMAPGKLRPIFKNLEESACVSDQYIG